MVAEILSVGEDLLLGLNKDQSMGLSQALARLGFSVSRHTTLSSVEKIREAVQEALDRSSVVFVMGNSLICDKISSFLGQIPKQLGESIFQFLIEGKFLIVCSGEVENRFLEQALNSLKRDRFLGSCSLCLLREKDVAFFFKELQTDGVEIVCYPSPGFLHITFASNRPVEPFINQVAQKFPSYFLQEGSLEQAIHQEMIRRKKTLGLAESCTGGAVAACLTKLPGASQFFSGSVVTYSNDWKERFLGLKRDTLLQKGAVSLETVQQMVLGLFAETEVDYALAVSGLVGPSSGKEKMPVGTIYIAVGKRGEKVDAGRIMSSLDRLGSIELTVQTALSALWRRIAHNTFTLS